MEYEVPLRKSATETVMVPYTVWVKDGMEWLRELVRDPGLSDQWTWYAEKKEVVAAGVAEQYVDSPMSAQDAWDEEVSLSIMHSIFRSPY